MIVQGRPARWRRVGGLMEDDGLALFICKEEAVIFAPGLGKLHESEELGPS